MYLRTLFGYLRSSDAEREKRVTEDAIKPCQDLEMQQPKIEEKERLWLQWLSALSSSFAMISCGSHFGWTSPALPHLTGPDSEFSVTVYQGSWIASIYILGTILGSLVSPPMVNRIGRKRAFLAFILPQLAGWAMIVPARSYQVLYGARLIAGLGHGGIYNVAVIYLAEIADKRVRGAFGTLLKTSTNLGSLFSATMGAYLSYEKLNLVSLWLPLVFLCTFVFMPESPYFHLMRGREDRAIETMLRLRRLTKPESVRRDLEAMRLTVAESRHARGGLWELVTKPSNRRSLWILLSLKVTQQLSGQMAIIAYTQEIFGHSGSRLAPEHAAIVLGFAQLAAGLLVANLVDRMGRRLLIICSGCVAAAALAVVGTFFYAREELRVDVSQITWIPIVALITYEIVVALGIGTVPYVILGEIFPTNVKSEAVATAIIIGSLFAFVVGLGFQALNSVAGIHTTFWFFSVCCCSGSVWVYLITPETKGMSLEEVQELFNPQKPRNNG
ncbi:PREDICTED: facilitated trehalose transporter Tret1-like [Ceratosolen solmsi marchali]|uniref:Facilitated trehalose transporter Tret1-like n=1 Tax=Ceratosolen solmsi marchali TaxID=326594 RepID=A0AAJ6VN33_9HYME|nr:PREDICTED: facilitated trehalose transporter Tret1-like [Ceratosolen solmsi marchali]